MGLRNIFLPRSSELRSDYFSERSSELRKTSKYLMNPQELALFLDEKHLEFNQANFITDDPISIPHLFSTKEDIEIIGFLTALIAWGKRNLIIRSAIKMTELMDMQPYQFVLAATEKDILRLQGFVHRTFNADDFTGFILALRDIYQNHGGLEEIFSLKDDFNLPYPIFLAKEKAYLAIIQARHVFINSPYFPKRTHKHLSNPAANSSAKRINMFLRWMIRKDNRGVDFGLWNCLNTSDLICPLDVHTGNIGRKLGLLTRTQDDAKAAIELTQNLRKMCAEDPVKYDFSLFGLGVSGQL